MIRRNRLANTILTWLDRLEISGSILLGSVAVIVGLASGAGIWLFRELIALSEQFFQGLLGASLRPAGSWTAALIPVVGGLIVGLLVHFFVGPERHHGVAGIMEAVALAGGRLRYRRIPVKAAASAISIGSGASVGPEDPSVQIGASAGSMFGQWLGFSEEHVRVLVAGGAAGGIASAFNAPIAGVFFALEIILGEMGAQPLGTVLVASVVASVFTQAVSGAQPAFLIPPYAFKSALELPLYLVLGSLCGVISAAYIWLLYFFKDLFQNWAVPGWTKPAFAGLLLGITGLFLPQILGVGYELIEQTLQGEFLPISLLLLLLFAKLILTPVSIGGGFQGGVFAPSLFLGAVMGAGFGTISNQWFPSLGILPPAFAMVGMAAVLAGAVHAPLTAILLLFEMTHDYRIILPLMLTVAVSLYISHTLQKNSVYTLSLRRKGIQLQRGRDMEVLEGIQVGEVMQKDFRYLHPEDTLGAAAAIFNESHTHGLPVVDYSGNLYGLLSIRDFESGLKSSSGKGLVKDFCTREPITIFPDETMGVALRRMSLRDVGRLPVVSRDDPRKLLGMLSRTNIVRAYDLALSRRAALRHRVHEVRLNAMRGVETGIIELEIHPNSNAANKPVNAIPWPRECLVASIRRGNRLIIPHGETILRAGDVLMVVAEPAAQSQLDRLFRPDVNA